MVNEYSFFLPMIIPTITAQEQKVAMIKNKPVFYKPQELKEARQKFSSHLSQHKPMKPLTGAVQLVTKWCFPRGTHQDGEYRSSKPDTDNLQKLLKDCMDVLTDNELLSFFS